jgi:hypothetical protein
MAWVQSPPTRSFPRHWLAFDLAPSLGAIRDGTVPASGPAANDTAQHDRGGALRAGIGTHCSILSFAAHGHVLDLNAAWFVVASKEWLFRIMHKVVDQQNSPMLHANAYHYRSDAYSSLHCHWTLSEARIIFSRHLSLLYFFAHLFFLSWFLSSYSNKASQYSRVYIVSAPELVLQSLSSSLDKLRKDSHLTSSFLHVRDLRAAAGSQLCVNVLVGVPGSLTAFLN